jgi:outer membrane receptor protein involved in Fe transport
MTSRGGTNVFHGSMFYYFRNDRLNANDWFANSSGYSRPQMRQNRPGGTFGGPVVKNRTYFFGSFEELRLDSPATLIASVPNLRSRRGAAASLRPYLNAFPIPNGANLEGEAAQFRGVVVNPSKSDGAALRIDHVWNAKTTLFARYTLSPSSGVSRASEMVSPNMLSSRSSRSHTVTLGGARAASATTLHDLRLNYSRSDSSSSSVMDDFGGAVPLTASRVFPAGVPADSGSFSLTVLGAGGYSLGSRSRNQQQQLNGVYSVTNTMPDHSLKAGFDYRRIMPTNYRQAYSLSYAFNGLSGTDGALSSGVATNAQVSSSVEKVFPVYTNFSAYAQDSWRGTERTTLTYGLRWDVNPAPGVRSGPKPLVLNGSSVTQDRPLYETRWHDIAPRLGLAYQMDTTQNREMVFRIGVGLFYDVGYGISAGAFNGAPYSSDRTITLATFPLTGSYAAPPVMPPEKPYGQVTGADSGLKSPIVWQWNTAIERYFGPGQMLSIGYTGTKGRRLLRTESQPSFGDTYEMARVATNGAESDYHGLQVQFRRRFASNVQTQVSYTYSHSIDSSSNDMGFGGGFASLFSAGQRGSSDYDIRHNLNFSGSYRVYSPPRGWAGRLLGEWFVDWVATFRTGTPFDIQGVSSNTSSDKYKTTSTPRNFRGGAFAQVRPDYNGKPLWIADPNVPGGRRVNAAAFEVPDGYEQGNLGRNVLRGFGAFQTDLSLRRRFTLAERLRLHLSAQAFNVFNNPNFANPSPNEGANLASANFGIMTRMLNQSFGGGMGSPYSTGGPRSVELALRFQF